MFEQRFEEGEPLVSVSEDTRDRLPSFACDLEHFTQHLALTDESGTRLTYGELAERADDLGARIGVMRQLVVLEASNDIASIVALIACLRAGHPVIVASDATRGRIETEFRPNVAIVAGEIVRLHDQTVDCHPDLSLMLSTSGSTGAAKLVRLSARALSANAKSIAEYLHISDDDVAVTSLPINYSYGLSVINSHLQRGAAIVLTDRSVVDAEFWALCTHNGVTSIAGVPYTYELLEARGFRDTAPETLRTMTQAGGRLSPELVRTFHEWSLDRGISFFTMYGQTEATARIAYLSPQMMEGHSDCIGQAVPGGRLFIAADGEDEPAPLGTTGELVYAGENVMMGYATSQPELARGHELTELRTGDLGQEVEPGLFRIVGRKSRFSKIAGLRISLDEIEALLKRHGVAANATGDDALIVIAATAADGERVQALLDEHTSVPARSVVVLAMPQTPRLSSGKVDYASIMAAGRAQHERAEAELRQDAGGASNIAAVLARALNRRSVRPEDSFVSLAGDSLAYIEVSMAIEQALGHLPDGWEELSVAQIAAMADERPADAHERRTRSVATEMLIRPVAMTLIITGHIATSFYVEGDPWKGGALALLMTAGYNATRFQRDAMISSQRWRLLGTFVARFLVLYYLLIAFMTVNNGPEQIGWSVPYLLYSYFGDLSDVIKFNRYWFLEAMFHLLLISLVLFSIPQVRRFAAAHRWWFATSTLAVATAAKFVVPLVISAQANQQTHRLDGWAYAYTLGLVAAEANTRLRKLFVVAASFILSGVDWGFGDLHNVMMVAAVLLILYLPRVRLWTPLAMGMAFFAQSTFYIYLSHGIATRIALRLHLNMALTVLFALVVGMIAYIVWRQVELAAARLFHHARAARHRDSEL